jgi:hypothetical protein
MLTWSSDEMVRWTSEARRVDTVNVTRRVLLDVVPGLCFFLAANYQTSAREAKLITNKWVSYEIILIILSDFLSQRARTELLVVCLLD